MKHPWEAYPNLEHIASITERKIMEIRRRHRKVRYLLFSLQTKEEKGEPLTNVPNLPPYFVEFWLQEKPKYLVDARGRKNDVPLHRMRTVIQMGGYKEFAKKWDVDSDLMVYMRHASVWQEWNATLMRVVPTIGE